MTFLKWKGIVFNFIFLWAILDMNFYAGEKAKSYQSFYKHSIHY